MPEPTLTRSECQYLEDLLRDDRFRRVVEGVASYLGQDKLAQIRNAHQIQNPQLAAMEFGQLELLDGLYGQFKRAFEGNLNRLKSQV